MSQEFYRNSMSQQPSIMTMPDQMSMPLNINPQQSSAMSMPQTSQDNTWQQQPNAAYMAQTSTYNSWPQQPSAMYIPQASLHNQWPQQPSTMYIPQTSPQNESSQQPSAMSMPQTSPQNAWQHHPSAMSMPQTSPQNTWQQQLPSAMFMPQTSPQNAWQHHPSAMSMPQTSPQKAWQHHPSAMHMSQTFSRRQSDGKETLELARKITEMLFEMHSVEAAQLLSCPKDLNAKIVEMLEVLESSDPRSSRQSQSSGQTQSDVILSGSSGPSQSANRPLSIQSNGAQTDADPKEPQPFSPPSKRRKRRKKKKKTEILANPEEPGIDLGELLHARHHRASVLELRPEHALGHDLESLSVSQLTGLKQIICGIAEEVDDVKVRKTIEAQANFTSDLSVEFEHLKRRVDELQRD
eukprot:816601_1